MVEVLQQFLASKTGDLDDCEDAIYVGEHFAAVVDGVTSKKSGTVPRPTPGRVGAETLCEALDGLARDATARETATHLTQALRAKQAESDALASMEAVAIVFSAARREVWAFGDAQALIGGEPWRNPKLVDQVLADVRALVIELELARGVDVTQLADHDPGREFILPLLRRQGELCNTDSDSRFAYAALDGTPFPQDKIRIHRVDESVTEIVLASDGYPRLAETLEQSEQLLADLLERDPLCFREFPATKPRRTGNVSFDDRAYLRIRI